MKQLGRTAAWAVAAWVLGGVFGGGGVRAADLYWDSANAGSTGLWDLAPANLSWDSGSAGGAATAWTDGNKACFYTVAGGNVPVAANVNTSGIAQNVALSITSPDTNGDGVFDYTITNTGNMTNPSYLFPLVTYNVNMHFTGTFTLQQRAVFNGPISGSATVSQQGGANGVTLAHSNPDFTGDWFLDNYRANLRLAADNPLGSGRLLLDGQRHWYGYGIIASGGARALSNAILISTMQEYANGVAFSGDALTFSGTTTFAGRYADVNAYAFRMDVNNTTEFSGSMGGLRGTLIKQGAGTLILSGTVTNIGATQVNEGTLLINGTHTGGGTYTVAAGATLGGSGTIDPAAGGTVTVSGTAGSPAMLAPGTSIGTLTVGSAVSPNDVVLGDHSTLAIETNLLGQSDRLVVFGTLDLTSDSNRLLLSGAAPADGAWFTIATYTTLAGNGFEQISWGAGLSVREIDYTYDGSSIAVFVIPEPAAGVLGLLAAVAVGLRRPRSGGRGCGRISA
jgi:autotransporter-associated beta strand protein